MTPILTRDRFLLIPSLILQYYILCGSISGSGSQFDITMRFNIWFTYYYVVRYGSILLLLLVRYLVQYYYTVQYLVHGSISGLVRNSLCGCQDSLRGCQDTVYGHLQVTFCSHSVVEGLLKVFLLSKKKDDLVAFCCTEKRIYREIPHDFCRFF